MQRTRVTNLIEPLGLGQVRGLLLGLFMNPDRSPEGWSNIVSAVTMMCPNANPERPEVFQDVAGRLASHYSEMDEFLKATPGAVDFEKKFELACSRLYYEVLDLLDDVDPPVKFLNLGFADLESALPLAPEDEPDRYSLQLYHQLVRAVTVEGAELLEVGCGRGGGASFVQRHFAPCSVVGLDRSVANIAFSTEHYSVPGLRFVQGNAVDLPFESRAFDVVFNVESAHSYPSFEKFVSEVSRVLRPSGHFLFTDTIPSSEMETTRATLIAAGFDILEEKDITANVMKAMVIEEPRRMEQFQAFGPDGQSLLGEVFGTEGPGNYDALKTRERVYVNIVARLRT